MIKERISVLKMGQHEISRVKCRDRKNLRRGKEHLRTVKTILEVEGREDTNIQEISQRMWTSNCLVLFCSIQLETIHKPGAAHGPVAGLPDTEA